MTQQHEIVDREHRKLQMVMDRIVRFRDGGIEIAKIIGDRRVCWISYS